MRPARREQPEHALTIGVHDAAAGVLLRECRFLRGWNGDDPNLPVQPLQQRRGLLHFEDNTFPEQNDFICDCFKIRYYVRRQQNDFLLGEFTDDTAESDSFFRVKSGCRLIQHQNFRVAMRRRLSVCRLASNFDSPFNRAI